MKKALFYILLILSSISYGQNDTCLLNSEIGISFPPVKDITQRNFAKLHLDTLGIKRMRFGEDWTFREPTPGNFNWRPLDDRMSWAVANNYKVLLTIQSRGPAWACGAQNANSCVFTNNANFKNYIDSLLLRYPNQIDKIQFGNEWQTDFWYVGNAQEFINSNNTLYNSVQTYSPSTQVVLGGFTTSSLRYLAACNGYINRFVEDDGTVIDSTDLATGCSSSLFVDAKNRIDSVLNFALYDIIDLHLYDDVENWPALIANFTDTITTPILVSEFGGPNMNVEPYTEAYQVNRTYKYIKVLDSIGISEIYYFKLVEGTANPAHINSGLIDDTTLTEKPVYWLVKSFNACSFVGLEKTEPNLKILSLYPNPTSGFLRVEMNGTFNLVDVRVTNELGQEIVSKTVRSSNFNVDITNHSPGMYFLYLTANGKKAVFKVIKND